MSGWTDYCHDWSSKDKLRLCSVYDALYALVLAANERMYVAGLANIPLPQKHQAYPSIHNAIEYFRYIDLRIQSLVPYFVNHTVNDGNLNGYTSIPKWTNGSIRGYGLRPDGTQKEMGYFGELLSPVDSTLIFTEISIGLNINGTEMDVPSLVPTLTDSEVFFMVTEGYKDASKIPQAILAKVSDYAKQRISQGKSPFAVDLDQDYTEHSYNNNRMFLLRPYSKLVSPLDWIYQQYEIINKLRWLYDGGYIDKIANTTSRLAGFYQSSSGGIYSSTEYTNALGDSISESGNNIYPFYGTVSSSDAFLSNFFASNAQYHNAYSWYSEFKTGASKNYYEWNRRMYMWESRLNSVTFTPYSPTTYRWASKMHVFALKRHIRRNIYELRGTEFGNPTVALNTDENLGYIHHVQDNVSKDIPFDVIIDASVAIPNVLDYTFPGGNFKIWAYSEIYTSVDEEYYSYEPQDFYIWDYTGSSGFQFKDW